MLSENGKYLFMKLFSSAERSAGEIVPEYFISIKALEKLNSVLPGSLIETNNKESRVYFLSPFAIIKLEIPAFPLSLLKAPPFKSAAATKLILISSFVKLSF